MSAAAESPEAVFPVALESAAWNKNTRGWVCGALVVPGAVVDAIYVQGKQASGDDYEVQKDLRFIRWKKDPAPTAASATIKLTVPLSTRTRTDRWKRIAIVLGFLAPIIAAIISVYGNLLIADQKKQFDKDRTDLQNRLSAATAVQNKPPAEISGKWLIIDGNDFRYEVQFNMSADGNISNTTFAMIACRGQSAPTKNSVILQDRTTRQRVYWCYNDILAVLKFWTENTNSISRKMILEKGHSSTLRPRPTHRVLP